MRNTFIDNGTEAGFWIDEDFLEVLCMLVTQVIEKRGLEGREEWYMRMYKDFKYNATGINYGYMGFLFEDYLNGEDSKENELISILEETKKLISEKEPEIGAEELRKLEEVKIDESYRNNWSIPIQTKDLIMVLDIIIKLLKHEWTSTDFEVKFEGFPPSTSPPPA